MFIENSQIPRPSLVIEGRRDVARNSAAGEAQRRSAAGSAAARDLRRVEALAAILLSLLVSGALVKRAWAGWCDTRPCVPVSSTLTNMQPDLNYWLSPPLESTITNARLLEQKIRQENGDVNACFELQVGRYLIFSGGEVTVDCYPSTSALAWPVVAGGPGLPCWYNRDDVSWEERELIYARVHYRSAPECTGTGVWSLTWSGNDWDYVNDLNTPSARAAAWQQYLFKNNPEWNDNLLSVPYNSPSSDALSLMMEVGGGSILPIAHVGRYLSSIDAIGMYTGRIGSPAPNFQLEDGLGYLVSPWAWYIQRTRPFPPTHARIVGRVMSGVSGPGLPGRIVTLQHPTEGTFAAITDASGRYSIHAPPGDVVLSVVAESGETYFPSEIPLAATSYTIFENNDFYRPYGHNLGISLYGTYMRPYRSPCPAQPMSFCSRIWNLGEYSEGTKVVLDLPDPPAIRPSGGGPDYNLRYVNCPGSYPPLAQPNAQNVFTWDNLVMASGEACTICVDAQVDSSVALGQSVLATATVYREEEGSWVLDPITGRNSDNTAAYAQTARCSWDPNDMQVEPVGCGPGGEVAPGTVLTYSIRFQNTGNAPATDVVVSDTLDSDLDPTALQVVDTSHSLSYVAMDNDRVLSFHFRDIDLPDSATDEPGSHGFVMFRIAPSGGIPIGTEIVNGASIVFDHNPSIATNVVVNTIADVADFDHDGYADCDGDCNDSDPSVYPHAPQLCDGKNNDCAAPGWPSLVGTNEADGDGDGLSACAGDCSDSDPSVFPSAAQLCDGKNNDCSDPAWPAMPADEADVDGDGVRICAGDCDDADAAIRPGAPETCDGRDNDCDGPVDEELTRPTGCGIGSCASTGMETCAAGTWGGDTCIPGTPTAEVCDSQDNDCDGSVDEGCGSASCDNPEKAGAEVRVSADDAYDSDLPSLFWSADGYGIAWRDRRDGNAEIYFAKLDPLGNRVGPEVRVTDDPAASVTPVLVWNGNGFGVSWGDARDGNSEIYFARLDASGGKVGPDVRVTIAAGESTLPSLVRTTGGYGVTWQDTRDGNQEIYFARLDPDGNKLGFDVRVTNDTAISQRPSLVWTGDGFGLAWQDTRDGNFAIYFARLDPDGNRLGPDVRVTDPSFPSRSPSLLWTPEGCALSWCESMGGAGMIFFARLDGTGNPVGPETPVGPASSPTVRSSLAWTGGEYGVAWDDDRDGNQEIYFARLDSSGNLAGPDVRVTDNTSTSAFASLVWTPLGYGIAWNDGRDGNLEIYFARVGCCPDGDGDGVNACHDCDDTQPSVYAGAPQLCDGKNNDCSDPMWPAVPANEADADADGVRVCAGDCNDGDPTVWGVPGEAADLVFQSSKTALYWEAPASPGGTTPLYDTLRSSSASDFAGPATCVETDGSDLQTTEGLENPALGHSFHYLVRAGNSCGEGTLGRASSGQERSGRNCP